MKDQHIGFQIAGYPDERCQGKRVMIAELALGREKVINAWLSIKPRHKFPEGVKFARLEEVREADSAIFVRDGIAEEQEAAAELQRSKEMAVAQAKADAAKRAKQLADATKSVSDSAMARNTANFSVNAAKTARDLAKSNLDAAQSDNVSAQSKKTFQKRLDDAEAILETANKTFAAADKAWQDAKSAKLALEKSADQNKPNNQ